MKHNFKIEGFNYVLLPICATDAQDIIDIRLEDGERNKFIHTIPKDVEEEKKWIEKYFEKEGDYFFKVVNKVLKKTEGFIAIYDQSGTKAEWGRWTVQKGSTASVESVYLLYKLAFSEMGLDELYCRTVKDNSTVVSFHKSCGLQTRCIHKNAVMLDNIMYDFVEQFITKQMFQQEIETTLEEKCYALFLRNLRVYSGGLKFHHVGVCCKSIKKEMQAFSFLGYKFENLFEDRNQGICGVFGNAMKQPRIELLSNLDGFETLTPYLDKGIKLYHFAYLANNIEQASGYLEKINAKIISSFKFSEYFKKRICFYMLPNMFLIELIEK